LYQPGGWRHACASDGERRGWPAGATASPAGHHYRSVQEHMFFPVRSVVPVPGHHPSGAAARRRATTYSAPTAAGTDTAPKRSSSSPTGRRFRWRPSSRLPGRWWPSLLTVLRSREAVVLLRSAMAFVCGRPASAVLTQYFFLFRF
jgi:hypothetical protein